MSEPVKRYDLVLDRANEQFTIDEQRDGSYVRYADYAALAQQLADVAYLDEWLSESPLSHYVIVETNRKMTAVDSLLLDETTVAEADSLPALGALLRQREEGR